MDVLGVDPEVIEADLVDLARDLDRRGLLAGVDRPHAVDHPRASGGAAGPSGRLSAPANRGLDARFDVAGARTVTVRDGTVELDLRVDDASLADELAHGLVAAGIDADPPRPVSDRGPSVDLAAAPLYSVLVGRSSGPVARLHLLYRSARRLRRCRHRADLIRITVADVAAVLDRETRRRPLLDAVGLTRGGRLVAVDPLFSSIVDDLERRLQSDGIERVDASLLALAPCDPGLRLTGLVLRPASAPAGGAGATPGTVALGAVDLARGPGGTISPDALARLCDVVTTTAVRRVPGRDALRATVIDLLG